jgi:hypothetical protein
MLGSYLNCSFPNLKFELTFCSVFKDHSAFFFKAQYKYIKYNNLSQENFTFFL